jgi:hypothetical protein
VCGLSDVIIMRIFPCAVLVETLYVGRFTEEKKFTLRREGLLHWHREIQQTVRLSENVRVVYVWMIAENYCRCCMGTVREPKGKGATAVGNRYQWTVQDTAH